MRLTILLTLVLVLSGISARAADLPAPEGRTVLTVAGDIAVTNAADEARFDMKMLDALPQHRLTMETPWTDGAVAFEGVLLRDLLDRVGAAEGATMLRASALNDYTVEIPVADAAAHDVLLAHSMNGQRMTVRDKGPVWVIYPLGDEPELRNQETHSKMIWQLARLVVR